jgi:hypothetical protein
MSVIIKKHNSGNENYVSCDNSVNPYERREST